MKPRVRASVPIVLLAGLTPALAADCPGAFEEGWLANHLLVAVIKVTYNDDGSLASSKYPSGREITYDTDAIGRITALEDASQNTLAEIKA